MPVIKKKVLPDEVLEIPQYNNPDTHNQLIEDTITTPPRDIDISDYQEANPWYVSSVVDSKFNPRSSLATFIRGARWVVTYFQSIRDIDEGHSALSTITPGAYQSYRKINKLTIKLERYIDPQLDEKTQRLAATGTGVIYCGLIPAREDVFLADIGNGRSALFRVTTVRRVNIYKTPITSIEFELIAFAEKAQKTIEDLNSKVIETRYYHENFLLNGTNPFLLPSETEKFAKLQRELSYMEDNYLSEFYNSATRSLTILLPKNVSSAALTRGYGALYDQYLVDFVKSTFEKSNLIYQLRRAGNRIGREFSRDTLWDLILNRKNKFYPNLVAEMLCLPSENNSRAMPELGGTEWGNVDFSVMPSRALNGDCISSREITTQVASHPALSLPVFQAGYYQSVIGVPFSSLFDVAAPVTFEREELEGLVSITINGIPLTFDGDATGTLEIPRSGFIALSEILNELIIKYNSDRVQVRELSPQRVVMRSSSSQRKTLVRYLRSNRSVNGNDVTLTYLIDNDYRIHLEAGGILEVSAPQIRIFADDVGYGGPFVSLDVIASAPTLPTYSINGSNTESDSETITSTSVSQSITYLIESDMEAQEPTVKLTTEANVDTPITKLVEINPGRKWELQITFNTIALGTVKYKLEVANLTREILVERKLANENRPIQDTNPPPVIYPVGEASTYILSPAFYDQDEYNYSTLESALVDYLENETVDLNKLTTIINDMPNWTMLDRFYLTPIVYSLLKMAVVGW